MDPPILTPDQIPLPPDDVPLPSGHQIPLPPEDIPLPPEEEAEQTDNHDHAAAPTIAHKRIPSPPQEPRPKRTRLAGTRKKRSSLPKKADHEEVETLSEEQAVMARTMGFSSFNSTKGKMVPGNQLVGAIHVVKRQRCRQYMNRKGGFNRPLDKTS